MTKLQKRRQQRLDQINKRIDELHNGGSVATCRHTCQACGYFWEDSSSIVGEGQKCHECNAPWFDIIIEKI